MTSARGRNYSETVILSGTTFLNGSWEEACCSMAANLHPGVPMIAVVDPVDRISEAEAHNRGCLCGADAPSARVPLDPLARTQSSLLPGRRWRHLRTTVATRIHGGAVC